MIESILIALGVLGSGTVYHFMNKRIQSANSAKSIAEARVDGEFTSIEDLRMRSGVNKTAIEVLRQEGCLDGM